MCVRVRARILVRVVRCARVQCLESGCVHRGVCVSSEVARENARVKSCLIMFAHVHVFKLYYLVLVWA